MYNVEDIARYTVNYCNDRGYSIPNLRLQKLLYFIQAQFIIVKSRVCFNEKMECWDYGPVVPSVYHLYRNYGSTNIPYGKKLEFDPTTKDFSYKNFELIFDDFNDKNIIDQVIEETQEKPVFELVRISHAQSPWKDNYVPGYKNELPIQSMFNYFGEK